MNKKIMIADDETRIRIMLEDFLTAEGYEVVQASDGREALDLFSADPTIKLIILDVMMPYINGWDVCKEIRKTSKVPVIMLTAKNQDQDELQGFLSGTDEYVKKPFNPMILMARVNAMFERVYETGTTISRGPLTLDFDKRSVEVSGVEVDLSQTEFSLLEYMVNNENIALSREQILNGVWGLDYEGSDRAVDTNMKRLRSKLGEEIDCLHTVWGYGYKFEVKS